MLTSYAYALLLAAIPVALLLPVAGVVVAAVGIGWEVYATNATP